MVSFNLPTESAVQCQFITLTQNLCTCGFIQPSVQSLLYSVSLLHYHRICVRVVSFNPECAKHELLTFNQHWAILDYIWLISILGLFIWIFTGKINHLMFTSCILYRRNVLYDAYLMYRKCSLTVLVSYIRLYLSELSYKYCLLYIHFCLYLSELSYKYCLLYGPLRSTSTRNVYSVFVFAED